MTVLTTTAKAGPYAGAGTTGPFPVPFRFLENSHLRVIRTSTAGVDTDLVLTTDYTVTGAGAASGSVTLTAALAVGEKLTVVRNVPATQEADYVAGDAFPAESHEEALDKLTMLVQQFGEVAGRTLQLAASATGASAQLPLPLANRVIGWNETATALVNVDAATLATLVAYGAAYADVFAGDGSQTDFTLSQNPVAIGNLDVSINGVTMVPGVDYTWASGTTLTFTVAPPNGSTVLARYLQGVPIGDIVDGSVTQAKLAPAFDATLVKTAGNQTIGGTKTFSSPIVGDITGNAATATNATNANNATTVTNGVYTNTAQTLTGPKRGTVTTDNDLSFNMNDGNNFSCTTSGSGTLTFTNITAGQSGFIKLTNASNHTISAAATTKIATASLTAISATGTYILSYFSDGTNVYVSASGDLT